MADILPAYALYMVYTSEIATQSIQITHRIRVELDAAQGDPPPGTDLEAITLATKGTAGTPGSTDARTGFAAYLAAFLDVVLASVTVTELSLRYYPSGFDSMFLYVSAADLTDSTTYPNLTGQKPGSATATQQSSLSMIDSRGKISRVQYNEILTATTLQQGYQELSAEAQALVDLITGPDSIVRGKGNSTFVQLKRWSNTRNEALYRKRHR